MKVFFHRSYTLSQDRILYTWPLLEIIFHAIAGSIWKCFRSWDIFVHCLEFDDKPCSTLHTINQFKLVCTSSTQIAFLTSFWTKLGYFQWVNWSPEIFDFDLLWSCPAVSWIGAHSPELGIRNSGLEIETLQNSSSIFRREPKSI